MEASKTVVTFNEGLHHTNKAEDEVGSPRNTYLFTALLTAALNKPCVKYSDRLSD